MAAGQDQDGVEAVDDPHQLRVALLGPGGGEEGTQGAEVDQREAF